METKHGIQVEVIGRDIGYSMQRAGIIHDGSSGATVTFSEPVPANTSIKITYWRDGVVFHTYTESFQENITRLHLPPYEAFNTSYGEL